MTGLKVGIGRGTNGLETAAGVMPAVDEGPKSCCELTAGVGTNILAAGRDDAAGEERVAMAVKF